MATAAPGRLSAFYVDQSATADGTAATLLTLMNKWSAEQSRDRYETTALGAASKTYVAGLADAKGSLSGFLDVDSNGLYTVADGNARKFYLYTDATSTATQRPVASGGRGYLYGTGTFDQSADGDVGDVMKVTLNWSAATPVTKL